MRNKKGSMELSINAIVVIVLAFTLLGAGLFFIRGQFKGITETTTSIQEQVKAQILDDLRTGNKRLSFPATELKMSPNDESVISIGVKNTKASTLNFKIEMKGVQASPNDDSGSFSADSGYDTSTELFSPKTGKGAFFWDSGEQTLASGEANVYGIKYEAETSGTFIYKVIITDTDTNTDTEYASKSFFVKVS